MRLHVITTPLGKLRIKNVSATALRDWLKVRRKLLEDPSLHLISRTCGPRSTWRWMTS